MIISDKINCGTHITVQQVRKNNRRLQKFYDAKYFDLRTGEKVNGQELNCGRRTRNKNLNTENLRKYSEKKVSPGRISIRKRRYPYKLGDTVLYDWQKCIIKGVQKLRTYIKLSKISNPVKISQVRVL